MKCTCNDNIFRKVFSYYHLSIKIFVFIYPCSNCSQNYHKLKLVDNQVLSEMQRLRKSNNLLGFMIRSQWNGKSMVMVVVVMIP